VRFGGWGSSPLLRGRFFKDNSHPLKTSPLLRGTEGDQFVIFLNIYIRRNKNGVKI